jgi:hypothetical protein
MHSSSIPSRLASQAAGKPLIVATTGVETPALIGFGLTVAWIFPESPIEMSATALPEFSRAPRVPWTAALRAVIPRVSEPGACDTTRQVTFGSGVSHVVYVGVLPVGMLCVTCTS